MDMKDTEAAIAMNSTEMLSNESEMEALKSNEHMIESRSKKVFESFLSLFCGFENSTDQKEQIDKQNEDESKRRAETFFSLNQTKFERYVLNINLIIILSVAVGLFVFFSVPPEHHIFRHIHLNRTVIL